VWSVETCARRREDARMSKTSQKEGKGEEKSQITDKRSSHNSLSSSLLSLESSEGVVKHVFLLTYVQGCVKMRE
jgi:hypothetical protein